MIISWVVWLTPMRSDAHVALLAVQKTNRRPPASGRPPTWPHWRTRRLRRRHLRRHRRPLPVRWLCLTATLPPPRPTLCRPRRASPSVRRQRPPSPLCPPVSDRRHPFRLSSVRRRCRVTCHPSSTPFSAWANSPAIFSTKTCCSTGGAL